MSVHSNINSHIFEGLKATDDMTADGVFQLLHRVLQTVADNPAVHMVSHPEVSGEELSLYGDNRFPRYGSIAVSDLFMTRLGIFDRILPVFKNLGAMPDLNGNCLQPNFLRRAVDVNWEIVDIDTPGRVIQFFSTDNPDFGFAFSTQPFLKWDPNAPCQSEYGVEEKRLLAFHAAVLSIMLLPQKAWPDVMSRGLLAGVLFGTYYSYSAAALSLVLPDSLFCEEPQHVLTNVPLYRFSRLVSERADGGAAINPVGFFQDVRKLPEVR